MAQFTREEVIEKVAAEESLEYADMKYFNLEFADLSGLDLRKTDLRDANLTCTDLTDALHREGFQR